MEFDLKLLFFIVEKILESEMTIGKCNFKMITEQNSGRSQLIPHHHELWALHMKYEKKLKMK